MRSSTRSIATVAVLLVAHPIVSLYRWLPAYRYELLAFPSVELAAILVLATLAGALGRGQRRTVLGLLAVVLSVVAMYSFAEAFYQFVYQESFVPWTDLAFLPPFLNMVFATSVFDAPVLIGMVYGGILLVVTIPAYGAVVVFSRSKRSRTTILLAAGTAVLAIAGSAVDGTPALSLRMARQLTPPTAEPAGDADAPALRAARGNGPFGVLGDADIHLIIVESYGHTLFSREDHRRAIAPAYAEAGEALADAGYAVYTSFLESPAFGGRSWLADATLLTGLFLDSQAKYNEAVVSGVENLTHVLGRAGFTRVLAAPGTYDADESWRSFYEYDHYLFRYDFGYEGPFISFGAMPDQFLLKRTADYVRDLDAPRFVTYVLVSSHVPFERIPPFIEDWGSLGDGSVYGRVPSHWFNNNWLSGGEYPQGYIAAIRYVLKAVAGYLVTQVDDDSLVIVVGDHQPRIPIAEPGASYSVPIHVISRDPGKVRPFRHFGFRAGLSPSDGGPHPRMDRFYHMLLDVINGTAEVRRRWERNVPR